MVQDLKTNRKAKDKLINHVCNVGARAAWKGGVCRVSDALDVAVMEDNLCI